MHGKRTRKENTLKDFTNWEKKEAEKTMKVPMFRRWKKCIGHQTAYRSSIMIIIIIIIIVWNKWLE